jgi:hypothetical protein
VAGDGKLVGEEAVVEEVLMPEATAIGSSLERVLHVAAGTAVLQGGLDRNGGDQWWCSPASRGARVRVEQRWKQAAWSWEKAKWSAVPLATSTRGIRMSRRAHKGQWWSAVYGDRWVTMGGAMLERAIDWRGPLSGSCGWQVGPDSISYFQRFSIIWTLKFESVTFLMSKIQQILQVNSLKHKEELYFFSQLQIPSWLHVTNSGTNSNLNLPWILKGFKPLWSPKYITRTITSTPLYQTRQGVFQTELEVLCFHLVDMYTPSLKIKGDIEFPKVIAAKQLPGKAWNWTTMEIEITATNSSRLKLGQAVLPNDWLNGSGFIKMKGYRRSNLGRWSRHGWAGHSSSYEAPFSMRFNPMDVTHPGELT